MAEHPVRLLVTQPADGSARLVLGVQGDGPAQEPARIVISGPADGSARLVLGDAFGPPAQAPDVVIAGAAAMPALAMRSGVLRARVRLSGSAAFPALSVRSGVLMYHSAAARPIVAEAAQPFQAAATREPHGVAAGHQDSPALPSGAQSAWQDAAPLSAHIAHLLPKVLQSAPVALRAAHQDAAPLYARTGFAHQQAQRLRAIVRCSFADGIPTERATGFAHQDGTKTHARVQVRWQEAVALGLWRGTSHQNGLALVLHLGARHQDGVPPPPGISPEPPEHPGTGPCYDPATLARLVLDGFADGGARIVLVCNRGGPGPEPGGEPVVVPIRKVYIVINNITLTRVDSGAPLHALSFSASLDVDSWTWQWSASLHSSAADHLGRETDGSPPAVLATINGVPLRLVIERISLNEQFLPQVRYSVSGRGRAAVLAAPWAPVLQHGGQATARTAEQLANEVLQINGVSIGWGIDWQMPEWTVPPGLWSSSGSYIDALSEIATAVGATIQPHPTDAVLRIMPRYPSAPWEWGGLAPDFVIPAAAAKQISTEFMDKPAYNGVYVGGTQVGVFGPVVRTGTVGDVLAPQVTHPLITDATAQRLRGLAVLSDTGKQRRVQLSMQVLPETGLIQPGKLVQIGTGASAYRGLVRSTAVEWAMPRLRQNIELEIHE